MQGADPTAEAATGSDDGSESAELVVVVVAVVGAAASSDLVARVQVADLAALTIGSGDDSKDAVAGELVAVVEVEGGLELTGLEARAQGANQIEAAAVTTTKTTVGSGDGSRIDAAGCLSEAAAVVSDTDSPWLVAWLDEVDSK